MDAHAERRYALGPLPLSGGWAPAPLAEIWDGTTAVVEMPSGSWLVSRSTADVEQMRAAFDHTFVSLDCWNAVAENATIGRFRIEHSAGGEITTTFDERRYPDLARAGVLPIVANEWLFERVRRLAKAIAPAKESSKAKKERAQRESARRVLGSLVDTGILSFVDGKTASSIEERARTVLYTLAHTRPGRIQYMRRMLRDSIYVAPTTKKRTDGELTAAIDVALRAK